MLSKKEKCSILIFSLCFMIAVVWAFSNHQTYSHFDNLRADPGLEEEQEMGKSLTIGSLCREPILWGTYRYNNV